MGKISQSSKESVPDHDSERVASSDNDRGATDGDVHRGGDSTCDTVDDRGDPGIRNVETDRVNVGATWNEVDTNLIAANLFSSTSSEETNDIRRQSQDDETKTNAYPDNLRVDANVDSDVARKRERWRHNSANYRARKRAAAAETPEELSQKRERWRRNSENYRDKKRAAAAETPEELSQKRERWRRNSENYRDKKRAAAAETPEELAQKRKRWRLNSEVFRTRNRTKHSDVRSRCADPTSHPGPLILESISTETRDAGMARLRKALGPDMLDEGVCLVCDRCVPRCEASRIEDNDEKYVVKMRCALGYDLTDLPDKLIKQYDCATLARNLSGLLLSRQAVRVYRDCNGNYRWWCMVCHECDRSIGQKKMPKFAIANGFYVGVFPHEVKLENMTIPERLMTQLSSVFSMTRVMRGGRHRCIRSHCVVFDATPGPSITLLPRSIKDLECFRVALVGDFTEQQLAKVRRMHKIRRSVVSKAFEFYKNYNDFYSAVESAQSTTDSSEGVENDSEILFDVLDDNGNLEAAANREQENIRGLTDNVTATDADEVEVIERRTGLLDDTSQMSISSMTDQSGRHSVAETFRDFLIKRSTHFSHDDSRTIFAKMFPHLFPFGRGHPGESRRVNVSLKECVKYYTMLSSRRFAEDELFVLVAFDRIAMQNMYTQTSFRCRRFPHLFDGYDKIDTESLAKVLLNNERRHQGGSTIRNDCDSVVDRFLKTVDIASSAVWGSNAERMQCRRQAFAYQTRFGQPALFLTLTPNTDNSLVMSHYAGITSVDSVFDMLAAELPTSAELRQASLGNDCIATRLFLRAVDAFIKHALGIDPKTKKPMQFRGLFGDVNAYFGMVETQGRGTLHVHFLIWLAKSPHNSAEVERLLLSPEGDAFRDSVKTYARSIVSNDLPLPVEDGKCRRCGSSYRNLIGLNIDPHLRQDPCSGLYSAEAKQQILEPFLLECGGCHGRFSSQHVLRQVLLDNRRLMPAWENHLSKAETEAQARVEAISRNTLEDAIEVVDTRERYFAIASSVNMMETPDMTTDQTTEFLKSINCRSMGYCTAAEDVFQNDEITRRIELMPPSPLDSRKSPSSLDYMVSVLVVLMNQHWWGHTASCFKASTATNDKNYCRYLYPRDRIENASFKASGVELPRKLAHEFINGFNYAMMATFKCNHDIQILLGGTEALDRMYYACKYVTKQQRRLDSVIPIAVAALKRRQEREKEDGIAVATHVESHIARSRKRVSSMVYSMTNRQEVAGPLAALYLHIGTCCYSSATCSKLPLGDMIRQLCSCEDYQCQLVVGARDSINSSSSATAVSILDDYIFRPRDLEMINVYEFVMNYFRRQAKDPQLSRYPFESGHPLSKSYCLGVHDCEYIPVISGYRIPGITDDTSEEDKLKHSIGSLVLFKNFRSVAELTGQVNPQMKLGYMRIPSGKQSAVTLSSKSWQICTILHLGETKQLLLQ